MSHLKCDVSSIIFKRKILLSIGWKSVFMFDVLITYVLVIFCNEELMHGLQCEDFSQKAYSGDGILTFKSIENEIQSVPLYPIV